ACLNPACSCKHSRAVNTRWSRVFLEDRKHCGDPCGKLLLPLSTCFQCGMPVVSVWREERQSNWSALKPSVSDNPSRIVMTWGNLIPEAEEEDDEGAGKETENTVWLCLNPQCGRFSERSRLTDCCTAPAVIELWRLKADEEGNLKSCPRCATAARPYSSV